MLLLLAAAVVFALISMGGVCCGLPAAWCVIAGVDS